MDLESESQRPSGASSSSSLPRSPPKGGSRPPPKPPTGSNLTKIAPFTSEAIARMRATKVEVAEGATQGKGSAMGSKETAICKYACNLDYYKSKVSQTQMDVLRTHFNVSVAIMMKACTSSKLLSGAKENGNKISFLVAAFECGVRLLLVPFMRQFLSELPLHPLQASLAL